MASAIPLLLLGGAVLLLGGKKKKKSTGGGKAANIVGNLYIVNNMTEYEILVGWDKLRGGVVTALLTGTGDAAISAAMKVKAETSPHINFLVARGSDAKRLALEFNQAAGPGIADPSGAIVAAFRPSQNASGNPMAAYMSDASPLVKSVRSGKQPSPTQAVASAVEYIEEETGKPSGSTGGVDPLQPQGGSGPPPPSGGSSSGSAAVMARQEKLSHLGYAGVPIDGNLDSKTTATILQFQEDWNYFVNLLETHNPQIDYKVPYTKIGTDGKWGPNTETRANKALSKFDGSQAYWVEELIAEVWTWREMIVGFKTPPTAGS